MASVFNTVKPTTGRVSRLLNFIEASGDFYVAIGKPTPWDSSFGQGVSDINPPSPNSSLITIPEPIIYKRVTCAAPASRLNVCLDDTSLSAPCPSDPSVEIRFDLNDTVNPRTLIQESFTESRYNLYDPNDIKIINGRYNVIPEVIYVQASIIGTEYNKIGWRASALFTKLFLADGVQEGQDIYFPNQVTSGLIQQVTYNTLVERQANKTHRFEYIITP